MERINQIAKGMVVVMIVAFCSVQNIIILTVELPMVYMIAPCGNIFTRIVTIGILQLS